MQGSNELRLNKATMTQIIQEWIDREIKSKPTVTAVSYHAGENTFIVTTSDAERLAA